MAKKKSKPRKDVSKNHFSQQLVLRHHLPELLILLNKRKLKIRHLLYDKETKMVAIHALQAISVGQLRNATNITWIACKGPQSSIPFFEIKNQSRYEKHLIAWCEEARENVNAEPATPAIAAYQKLISKVEQLEAEKLVTAAALRNAQSEIESLRAQLECGVNDTTTEPISYEDSGKNKHQSHPETRKSNVFDRDAGLEGPPDGPVAPAGFRFATSSEIPAGSTGLLRTQLLYKWPDFGWVRGKVFKRIYRNGFTHTVRYPPGKMWPSGAVVDTLLDAEWYYIRWIILLPLDRSMHVTAFSYPQIMHSDN